jgi:hypothetical protein
VAFITAIRFATATRVGVADNTIWRRRCYIVLKQQENRLLLGTLHCSPVYCKVNPILRAYMRAAQRLGLKQQSGAAKLPVVV